MKNISLKTSTSFSFQQLQCRKFHKIFDCIADIYTFLCLPIAEMTSHRLMSKGPLTIWPVYAYTLAAQNTFIKLLMLILSVENNTSMSCEAIYAKIFVYFVII